MTENSVYDGAHLEYERMCQEPSESDVKERAEARQSFCSNILAGNLAKGRSGYYDFSDLINEMPKEFLSRYELHSDEQILSLWHSGKLEILRSEFNSAAMSLADGAIGEAL